LRARGYLPGRSELRRRPEQNGVRNCLAFVTNISGVDAAPKWASASMNLQINQAELRDRFPAEDG